MKRKLFLDTNILLDLLGEREPFYLASAQLASLADQKQIELYISPVSIATVQYVLAKHIGQEATKDKLRKLLILCKVASMDESIVQKSMEAPFEDFEDALQYYCALHAQCDVIISRNAKDFKKALLPVLSAEAFLSLGR
jgi:predicted nucleic acid-binding protein